MRHAHITIEPDHWGRGDALVFDNDSNLSTSIVIDVDDECTLLDLLQRRAAERCTGGDDCTAPTHIHGCFADHGGSCSEPDEHPPTREQIAEAIYTVRAGSNQNWHRAAFRDDYLKEADAVLALLQKGAER